MHGQKRFGLPISISFQLTKIYPSGKGSSLEEQGLGPRDWTPDGTPPHRFDIIDPFIHLYKVAEINPPLKNPALPPEGTKKP